MCKYQEYRLKPTDVSMLRQGNTVIGQLVLQLKLSPNVVTRVFQKDLHFPMDKITDKRSLL